MEDSTNVEVGEVISTPLYQPEKKSVSFGCFKVNLTLANIIFACITIVGRVAHGIALPLWIDSTAAGNHTLPLDNTTANVTRSGNSYQPGVDSYFVLFFFSLSFLFIFGAALLFIRVFQPERLGETERRFPHLQLFLVGLCGALNGVLIAFSCSGTRTPTYLQPILENSVIPMTIGLRFLFLRKVPTLRKFICAMTVMLSIFICLIPKIFTEIDPEAHVSASEQSGPGRILWSLCYMFGIAPGAVVIVFTEKGLKMQQTMSRSRVNLVFFKFWTSVYQFLVVALLFWTDFLPSFGNVDSIYNLWNNWSFGFKCFFGGAGCSSTSGIRGTIFIVMYTVAWIAGANLMRFSEGATLFAIVSAVVTPFGFLFWTLFKEIPFQWHPAANVTTWFSIGGLVLMVPAIYFYNTGANEKTVRNRPTEEDEESLLLGKSGGYEKYT